MESFEIKHSETDFEPSSKIVILAMVGLPGSGKTTLCQTLRRVLGSKYHIFHVCYDEIVPFHENWSSDESRGLWKMERAKVLLAAETFIQNIMYKDKLGVKENTTVSQNLHKESKLFADIHQKSCRDTSKLLVEKNKDISTRIKANEKAEAPEYVGIIGKEDEKLSTGHNHLEEKEQPGEHFSSYSILNAVSQSLPWIETLNTKVNCCQRGGSESEVILLCIDDNCYYRSMRKEWWNLAAKYELSFCTLVLKCDVETCIERVKRRMQSNQQPYNINVPVEVIKRMAVRMEFPDENVDQWEKHSLTLDSYSLKFPSLIALAVPSEPENFIDASSLLALNNIKHLLHSCMMEPVKPHIIGTNTDPVEATPSLVHRVDLALRQIVGKSDKSHKAQVNEARKIILNELRKGNLYIPDDIMDKDNEDGMNDLINYLTTLI